VVNGTFATVDGAKINAIKAKAMNRVVKVNEGVVKVKKKRTYHLNTFS